MDCSTPSLPVYHQLPEFTQTHVHRVGDAIQPSHPLSSPSPLPSVFPRIRVFSSQSVLHIRWPKYWSSSFSISPSNEYSGLIFFRIDWFDLLAVQGALKSLPQLQVNFSNHKSTPTTVQNLQFFGAQLYDPTLTSIRDYWKNHSLTRWTFVSKVTSLLFNTLSRLS